MFHLINRHQTSHQKFPLQILELLKFQLYLLMLKDPSRTLASYVFNLKKSGFDVNPAFISRIFTSWRWSFKKPERRHILKYTSQNIKNYVNFSVWISNIAWQQLKFVDEVSFVSRNLRKKQVLGPVNQKVILVDHTDLSESYTATALINLAIPSNPLFISVRKDTNSQADFLLFIIAAIESENLVAGDFLVLDNASVHGAYDTWNTLKQILDAAQVNIVFLPMYSPELNPIELVFAQVKHYLRHHRDQNQKFLVEVIKSFIQVKFSNLLSYFYKTTQSIFQAQT
jgi:hypothetical protein